MKDYEKLLSECTHGQPPACSTHCYFNLDVKTVLSRFKRSKVDSAYRVLRDTVIFPEIACMVCDAPCEKACERNSYDEPLNLKGIERFIVDNAKRKDPIKLNIPAKDHKIAIIGGGISGLACALRLAERKYDVTLYEAADEIGGSLSEALDKEYYLASIEHQFEHRSYELKLGAPIKTIDELRAIDAKTIYVATGECGEDFGLLNEAVDYAPLKVNGNVFFGGKLIGATLAESIKHGADAANMMEIFINTGSALSLVNATKTHSNKPDPDSIVVAPRVIAQGEVYTKEEAMAEAERCAMCDCNICMKQCPLIKEYGKYPDTMGNAVQMTVAPAGMKNSLRMVSTCNMCGICTDLCPYGIDIREVFEDARAELFKAGNLPVGFSQFWLDDMNDAAGDGSAIFASPTSEPGEYAFFPGCQLGASDPRYVTKTYSALLEAMPNTSLMLTCCGAPNYWAGDRQSEQEYSEELARQWESLGKPKLICACTSCMFQLRKALPDAEVVSLYELPEFLEAIEPSAAELISSGNPGEVSVFHPCSARYDESIRSSAKSILEKAGLSVVAENSAIGDAACCGWGGQYQLANAKIAGETTDKIIESFPADTTMVTYCTNCRNTLYGKNGNTLHILDIAFGLNSSTAKPPTITMRRLNRKILKATLENEIWGKGVAVPEYKPTLLISDEVAQAISDRWIYEDDISQTIEHCEKHDQKLYYPEKDCFICHAKIGYMTYWVFYKEENGSWRVLDAYCHRMNITEGKQWTSPFQIES